MYKMELRQSPHIKYFKDEVAIFTMDSATSAWRLNIMLASPSQHECDPYIPSG